MDLRARNQYLETIVTKSGYHSITKKQKSEVLKEYCKNTGQSRKHVICKIQRGLYLHDKQQRKKRIRKKYYDNAVTLALIACWRIFDYPCGQRLKPVLKQEVERLRMLGELKCSEEVADKLKKISFRTIDEKLKRQKEIERLRKKYYKHNNPLLYQKIPVKLSDDLNRKQTGNIQIDLVEHCGQSVMGEYICTLSTNDIATGWWEGEAIMGKGQNRAFCALKNIRKRYPFFWREIHSDNGSEFINWQLLRYIHAEKLGFSRSRPNKKNDNCFVEQKNWTHVKKFVGYFRYDTLKELWLLNLIYLEELRLYKNFFQPVIKLASKERIGGKIHRRYGAVKTPYQRVLESKEVPQQTKTELKQIYDTLNPAQLKRSIDKKQGLLFSVYQKKNRSQGVEPLRKIKPSMVRKLIA